MRTVCLIAALATLTVMCRMAEAQVLYSGPLTPGSTVTSQQPLAVNQTIQKYGSLALTPGYPTSIQIQITTSDLVNLGTSWKRSNNPVVFTVKANTETNVTCEAALTLTNAGAAATMAGETTVSMPGSAKLETILPPPGLPPGSVRGFGVKAGWTELTVDLWAKPPGGRWTKQTKAGKYTSTLTVTMTAR